MGERVYAVHDGIFEGTAWSDGCGNRVNLRSDVRHPVTGEYIVSRYLHLRYPPLVSRGERVTAGTHIGYVGNTGRVSSSGHLHLEFNNNGIASGTNTAIAPHTINPQRFFPHIEFTGNTNFVTP
ncbi:MAG: M23 family metallopeptidase [Defluviitaleaceae bacterium]|nr:M23 family metallopeptidase [Defluviitaleaceae bacterium]